MLRSDLQNCFLTIISHARPHNVEPMTELVGEAMWFVGKGEAEAYLDAGAPAVVESGGLCASRNAALDLAFANGAPCIQLSDDLKRMRSADDERDIPFHTAIAYLYDALKQSRFFKLAGVAPTDNAFYYNPRRPIVHQAFVVGDLILVLPTSVRFDENLLLKEDYDYTLEHLSTYGGVVRRNDILCSFAHRTNGGGAVSYRTPDLEQETIAYLKSKWGSAIKDNERRENEILLHLPRQQQRTGKA